MMTVRDRVKACIYGDRSYQGSWKVRFGNLPCQGIRANGNRGVMVDASAAHGSAAESSCWNAKGL